MRTGMTSNKPKDVDYRVAVQDYETRKIFIQSTSDDDYIGLTAQLIQCC